MVVCAWDPSYLGNRGRRIINVKTHNLQRPCFKNERGKGSGEMAQWVQVLTQDRIPGTRREGCTEVSTHMPVTPAPLGVRDRTIAGAYWLSDLL